MAIVYQQVINGYQGLLMVINKLSMVVNGLLMVISQLSLIVNAITNAHFFVSCLVSTRGRVCSTSVVRLFTMFPCERCSNYKPRGDMRETAPGAVVI